MPIEDREKDECVVSPRVIVRGMRTKALASTFLNLRKTTEYAGSSAGRRELLIKVEK
jgi:hypothetical protein